MDQLIGFFNCGSVIRYWNFGVVCFPDLRKPKMQNKNLHKDVWHSRVLEATCVCPDLAESYPFQCKYMPITHKGYRDGIPDVIRQTEISMAFHNYHVSHVDF